MVPDFEEKAGKISKTATFNVIVITRLFYYKTPRHKESDVVQFLVSVPRESIKCPNIWKNAAP